jgi:CheY-like chemotaxis protein
MGVPVRYNPSLGARPIAGDSTRASDLKYMCPHFLGVRYSPSIRKGGSAPKKMLFEPRVSDVVDTDVTKVLIIDESQAERYLIRRDLGLSSLHYQVYEAEDGRSGLALTAEVNPDCILLDLKLPDQSGFQVLQQLIGDGRPPKRAVIVFTVLSTTSLRDKALSLGAADFLIKGRTDPAGLDRPFDKPYATTKQLNKEVDSRKK